MKKEEAPKKAKEKQRETQKNEQQKCPFLGGKQFFLLKTKKGKTRTKKTKKNNKEIRRV